MTSHVQENASVRASKHVLVVEDEPEISEYLCEDLNSIGYTVVAARNGYEAKTLIENNPSQFDIVISDLRMPEVNGLDLLEYAKAVAPNIKFIVITAYAEESEELLIAMGVDEFLLKPFQSKQFIELVKRVEAQASARKPTISL